MSADRRGLWQHRDFMKLWTGQTISKFGSQIGGGALRLTAILVLGATPLQLGFLTAASALPTLLLGLLAGVWVDRLRRRPLLIVADLLRAVLLLSIPIAYLIGALTMAQLYLVALLVGTLTLLFDVAYGAYVPSVVQRAQLIEGNSKLGMSDSVAEIAGPPLGGVLVQIISAPFAILLDALSFVGSAFALWQIRVQEPQPAAPATKPHLQRPISAGLHTVRHDRLLQPLLIASIVFNLGGGMIGSLYDVYLIRALGFSPALVGVTIGAGGVAALIGAFVTQTIVARRGIGPAIAGSLLVSGVAGLLLPLANGPVGVALPLLLLSQTSDVAIAVYLINETSLRQAITPDHVLGRVNANFTVWPAGALLLGSLLGGALGQVIGLRATLTLGVGGVIVAALLLWRSPVRKLHTVPHEAHSSDQIALA